MVENNFGIELLFIHERKKSYVTLSLILVALSLINNDNSLKGLQPFFLLIDLFSQFDDEIFKRWDNAMELGCFKYNLDFVKRRIIPGKYNFVAQVTSSLSLLA